MKKRMIIALLAAAVLVLAACGNKNETAPSAAQTEQAQESQTQAVEIDAQAVYESLEGCYQDSVGQRAVMNTWLTDDGLGIRVIWASSAFQEREWNMTAVLTQDNQLAYTDGTCSEITYLADNAYDSKEISSNQEGFFTIEGDKLLWNSAPDEACKACVFEPVPEEAANQSWEPEYEGVYLRTWSEEIGGKNVEHKAYIVLNEDGTGYWIAQDVGMLSWDESQLMLTIGATYDIALTQEGETVSLLVYEFQNENGEWIPTVFEKIESLPAEMEELLARA